SIEKVTEALTTMYVESTEHKLILSYRNRKPERWITPEIVRLMKLKDKAYKRHRQSPSNSSLQSYYRSLRNLLNRKILLAKRQEVQHNLQLANKDPRKIWQVINKTLSRNSKENNNL